MPIFNKEHDTIGQPYFYYSLLLHAHVHVHVVLLYQDIRVHVHVHVCPYVCSGVVKLTNKLSKSPFDPSDEEVFQVGC